MDKALLEIEENLIIRAKQGDDRAYKVLYDKYCNAFFAICLRYSSSREEAEDMLQDSMIKIFRELHTYDKEKGTFYTWGARIVINTNLASLRKSNIKYDALESENLANTLKDQYNVLAELELKDVVAALQEMPSGYRTVFNLYYFEGYNHQEIAEQLGVSESTSKTQLMKSKVFLKKSLEDLELAN
ncbi:MAG: RNA polymerase sigma factor [Saprospiraceae bacterium]|nr:RNA polymerase sigma factor [Candidatus Vicinibacter affinis]MBK6571459.1 RNA polymerase sigma factor [Candidatus Vicinibacter affinis]MBK6823396.1 RNA polymerase sigma factor [Candidatus Vicinibacter affinis]MBK7304180.1 RNA polymerase sigma factor [Candidatus Vicinibacter affinis]MBK7696310.1 RNA polymerase sigma factor [Candidatus Vicinibacter affinis]